MYLRLTQIPKGQKENGITKAQASVQKFSVSHKEKTRVSVEPKEDFCVGSQRGLKSDMVRESRVACGGPAIWVTAGAMAEKSSR
jgi:hypothetical protein